MSSNTQEENKQVSSERDAASSLDVILGNFAGCLPCVTVGTTHFNASAPELSFDEDLYDELAKLMNSDTILVKETCVPALEREFESVAEQLTSIQRAKSHWKESEVFEPSRYPALSAAGWSNILTCSTSSTGLLSDVDRMFVEDIILQECAVECDETISASKLKNHFEEVLKRCEASVRTQLEAAKTSAIVFKQGIRRLDDILHRSVKEFSADGSDEGPISRLEFREMWSNNPDDSHLADLIWETIDAAQIGWLDFKILREKLPSNVIESLGDRLLQTKEYKHRFRRGFIL